jgi:hypothetical protein
MLVYRIFPHLPSAAPGAPGHPCYLHPSRGGGRLDNPARYSVWYLSYDACGAIGEVFGNQQTWSDAMFAFPDDLPTLDLDDAHTLLVRGLRPTQVVERNRSVTQAWALRIYDERNDHGQQMWQGVKWWSFHRPQWRLLGYWGSMPPAVVNVEALNTKHYAIVDAANTLCKPIS